MREAVKDELKGRTSWLLIQGWTSRCSACHQLGSRRVCKRARRCDAALLQWLAQGKTGQRIDPVVRGTCSWLDTVCTHDAVTLRAQADAPPAWHHRLPDQAAYGELPRPSSSNQTTRVVYVGSLLRSVIVVCHPSSGPKGVLWASETGHAGEAKTHALVQSRVGAMAEGWDGRCVRRHGMAEAPVGEAKNSRRRTKVASGKSGSPLSRCNLSSACPCTGYAALASAPRTGSAYSRPARPLNPQSPPNGATGFRVAAENNAVRRSTSPLLSSRPER